MGDVVYEEGERILLNEFSFKKSDESSYACVQCKEVIIKMDGLTKSLEMEGEHRHPADKGWRAVTFRRRTGGGHVHGRIEGQPFVFRMHSQPPFTNTTEPKAQLKLTGSIYSIETSWPILNGFSNTISVCELCSKLVIRREEMLHRQTAHSLQTMFSEKIQDYVVDIADDMQELVSRWEKLPKSGTVVEPSTSQYIRIPVPSRSSSPRRRVEQGPLVIFPSYYHAFVIDLFTLDCLTLDKTFDFKELYTNQAVTSHFQGYIGGHHDGRNSELANTKHIISAIPNCRIKGSLIFRYQLPDQTIVYFCSVAGCKNVASKMYECQRHQRNCFNFVGICFAKGIGQNVLLAVTYAENCEATDVEIARRFHSLIKNRDVRDFEILWTRKFKDAQEEYIIQRESIKMYVYLMTEAWNARNDIKILFANKELAFPPQASYEALRLAKTTGLQFLMPTLEEIIPACPGLEALRAQKRPLYDANFAATQENCFLYFHKRRQHYYIGAKTAVRNSKAWDKEGGTTKTQYSIENGPYEAYHMMFVGEDENVLRLEAICQVLFFVKSGLDLLATVDQDVHYEPLKLCNWRSGQLVSGILTDIADMQQLACSVLGRTFMFKNSDIHSDVPKFLELLRDNIQSHEFSPHREIFNHPLPGKDIDK